MKEHIKICNKMVLNMKEVMAYAGWGENMMRQELDYPKEYLRYDVFSANSSFVGRNVMIQKECYYEKLTEEDSHN